MSQLRAMSMAPLAEGEQQTPEEQEEQARASVLFSFHQFSAKLKARAGERSHRRGKAPSKTRRKVCRPSV